MILSAVFYQGRMHIYIQTGRFPLNYRAWIAKFFRGGPPDPIFTYFHMDLQLIPSPPTLKNMLRRPWGQGAMNKEEEAKCRHLIPRVMPRSQAGSNQRKTKLQNYMEIRSSSAAPAILVRSTF